MARSRQPQQPPGTHPGTPNERRVRRLVALVIAVAAIAVGVLIAVQAGRPQAGVAGTPSAATTTTAQVELVREDSRTLNDTPNAEATFVEFLDFECEACAAAFPAIEEIRRVYGDKVSFVVRYFPIPSHFNSERSARAVEAAAQQGQFEAMYAKMYQTQQEWGEQQTPKDDLFRQYAEELGLDMATWDAAYNSPKTLERIQRDFDDGVALGVQGTPTFFLDGQLIEPESFGELAALIDGALAE